MSSFNDTAIIVDDQDPSVLYSGNWDHVPPMGSIEYMSTKSGAGPAGLTATFKFTGTGVEVYGSQGSVDVYGVPTTTYTIDGALTGTYVQPVIAPGFFTTHTLFFRSPSLTPGAHELVIKTTNGTSPNMYWLDYIIYTPSADVPTLAPSQPQQSSASRSPSQPPPSQASQSSSATSQQQTSSKSTSFSSTPTTGPPSSAPSSSTDSPSGINDAAGSTSGTAPLSSNTPSLAADISRPSHVSTGAIAGGVIGGVILSTLIAALLFVFCRRKHRRAPERDMLFSPPGFTQASTDFMFPSQQYESVHAGAWRGDESGNGDSNLPYAMPPVTTYRIDPFTDVPAPASKRSESSQVSSPQRYLGGGSSQSASQKGLPSNIGVTRSTSNGSHSSSPSTAYSGMHSAAPLEINTTALSQYSTLPSSVVIPLPSQPNMSTSSHSHGNVPTPVLHHEDSGVRFEAPRPVVEVPPAYTQA
ncbi:hypothetical protein EUX98_g4807 [Antrodiella citrinella]|uniref:Uncharacterized protein n=1 Tax=Antrodiella citrinella TaxID=2447956 RepID=A0A4S4MTZ7_9APHY|nr:hypothetical protein EUX98_g4807 [Antrodiella citrinella]